MAIASMAAAAAAAIVGAVREHVRASDLAVAGAVLFAFSAAVSAVRARRRGAPVLWPLVGIVPTLFVHRDDIYEWGSAALLRAGGVFPYRGTWGGAPPAS
ncbi:hypothetical protein OsJ_07371 [Oryza sativa Japonica Group]|uniref:Uncharacterized protein n=1 Tax=Oryza sativa subsp. japonica TaxID=39947 RepID=B9F0V4_ORYSJ|nr:hypothetical protein OsJ_07371 [Oryza sativa Japonica Group]